MVGKHANSVEYRVYFIACTYRRVLLLEIILYDGSVLWVLWIFCLNLITDSDRENMFSLEKSYCIDLLDRYIQVYILIKLTNIQNGCWLYLHRL